MAVTITKTKPAKQAVAAVLDSTVEKDVTAMSIEELADAYGTLEDRQEALLADPVFVKFGEVKKELTARLAEYDPTQELEVKGLHWLLDVGVAAKTPAVLKDIDMARKFLGDKVFMQIAKLTITDVRKYLNPEQCAKVLDEESGYTDRRKIIAKFMG